MTNPPTPKRFSGRVFTTSTQPPHPTSGDFWLNPTTGVLKVWDSAQWLDVTGERQTGLSSGGILSIGTDTAKFDLTAGSGMIVDNYTTPGSPTVTPVSWSAFDEVTVTNLATQERTFIAINSSGAIVQQAGNWTIEERRDLIVIGLLVHPDNLVLLSTVALVITTWDLPLQLADFVQAIGPMNVSGNVISANGSNLNIDRSAGSQYRLGANYETSTKNPSVGSASGDTALTFRYRFRNGSGGYSEGSDVTVIDPANYDDDSGTPATIAGADKWTVQRIWAFATGTVRVMYGQNKYRNLAEAEAAIFGEVFDADANLLSNAVLRGWLIVKNDAVNLANVAKAKFIEADQFGSTPSGGVSSATTTLQQAYDNSDAETEILLDGGGVLTIRDATIPIGDLFEVGNNGGTTDFFLVDASGIIVDGTIRLEERAASLADVAARGQVWVKSGTPNQLMFTDDAGNDVPLGIPALAAPPATPIQGQKYWDTGDLTEYFYDAVRDEWFGSDLHWIGYGRAAAVSDGEVLRSDIAQVTGNNAKGWIPAWAATVVELGGQTSGTFTGSFEVRHGATATGTLLSFVAEDIKTDLVVDHDLSTTLSINARINIGSGTPSNPTFRMGYRRRQV